ncbi:outer membrane protein assembly factor BamE [Zooshikella harenae]|uniref:Outer membrane protein assembly factor BamE n=1 Tax=Zooshikella harenae TaxID=2827238 RepID=A0ABS5Z984_9GAMM|nr:outer membrane protein assembly factor BamE [Zooshikella harenae]MBU2710602.1 outer membrane protein assembly factor BamE [Zooshikella harenae]
MQNTLTKFTFLASLLICISGCSFFSDSDHRTVSFPGVYKIDIQQGNIITQDMVNQLRPGMTKQQVRFILGSPLLIDSFNQERWDYVYSFQPGGEGRSQETLSIFFKDDILTHFSGDFRPDPKAIMEEAGIPIPEDETSADVSSDSELLEDVPAEDF